MSTAFDEALTLMRVERAPREDIERAGELLQQASSEGHADASERCAMFEAFGLARPQSWGRALDYLEVAARQGSVSAQQQLLLLADNGRDPQAPSHGDAEVWRRLRAAIDIRKLISTGEKRALRESPRLRLIKAFVSSAEARWLVSIARNRLAPATVFDKTTGGQVIDRTRSNSYLVVGIDEMNVVTEVIRHRISNATRLPVPLFEPSQLLHYAVGQSFSPHYDFLDTKNPAYAEDLARFGQRIATFLIYLNDGYSGGETEFSAIRFKFHAEAGDALFFANVTRDGRPDPMTLHAGLPPTQGEKWVFSQWIRDRLPAQ